MTNTKQAEHAYKRALERGFIVAPKRATLEQYGLTEWWEHHRALDYAALRIYDREMFRQKAQAKETRANEAREQSHNGLAA